MVPQVPQLSTRLLNFIVVLVFLPILSGSGRLLSFIMGRGGKKRSREGESASSTLFLRGWKVSFSKEGWGKGIHFPNSFLLKKKMKKKRDGFIFWRVKRGGKKWSLDTFVRKKNQTFFFQKKKVSPFFLIDFFCLPSFFEPSTWLLLWRMNDESIAGMKLDIFVSSFDFTSFPLRKTFIFSCGVSYTAMKQVLQWNFGLRKFSKD